MKDLDIKEIWNQAEDNYTFEQSEDRINKLIKQRPKTLVHRFINMIRIEMWFNLVVLLAISLVLSIDSSWYWFIGINAINGLAYYYYQGLIKKLSIEYIDSNVLEYLKEAQSTINRFLLHYKVAIWVFTIPAFSFGLYWRDGSIFSKWDSAPPQFYITVCLGFALAIMLGYAILYFWYGKKANRIRDMVNSLAEEEKPNS